MSDNLEKLSSLDRYTVTCERVAAEIIKAYSTSFGLATRLLGHRHRIHVRNIYALVRVADELVDGVAAESGVGRESQRQALDLLEAETERAVANGYSSNPVVHAFAHSARAAGINAELTRPFFASMRTDLQAANPVAAQQPSTLLRFGSEAHADYVYGSAEVVGLMCLQVFIRDESYHSDEESSLRHGARRLGAAFQNVNFLRDLADDTGRLGRSYLSERSELGAEELHHWISTIRAQLTDARATLPLLPRDARLAVGCALRLFARLTDKIAKTPAALLYQRRVRVPAPEKVWLAMRATLDLRKKPVT